MKVVVANNGKDAEIVISENEWLDIGRSSGFITEAEAKIGTKSGPVFLSTHDRVTDNKDHFPINNAAKARNALARVMRFPAAPPWWSGTLEELQSSISRAVSERYPGINISKQETP